MKKKFYEHSLSFWYLNILIYLFVLLPKFLSILDKIPLRVGLMLLFPCIVFYDYKKGKIKFNKNSSKLSIIVYLILILSMIPSLFVTYNLISSLYTVIKFIAFFIVFYLVSRINYNEDEQKILFKSFLISSMLTVIYGIIDYVFDINLFKLSNSYYDGMKGRIRSTFFNSCYYATYLNLIFPFLIYKLYVSKDKRTIALYIIFIATTFLSFLFCFTRSAMLVFIILLLMMLFLFRKIKFSLITLIVFIIMLLIVSYMPGGTAFLKKTVNDGKIFVSNIVSFLPKFNNDFITNNNTGNENKEPSYEVEETDFEDPSLQHRESFAKMAKRIAFDNPFTGIGAGAYLDYINNDNFAIKYPEYKLSKIVPHSSLLLLSAECGILSSICLVIFISIIVYKFIAIVIIRWKEKDKIYYLGSIGLIVSAGFIVVSILSENTIYDTQIYPLYLIIIGILFSVCYENISSFENKIRFKSLLKSFISIFKHELPKKDKTPTKILFISSTGGHLDEMLQLKEMFNKYNFHIITEKTKSNVGLKAKYPNKVNYLVYGTKDHKLTYPFKLLYNCFKSLFLYIKIRPKFIVTTGAHTAGPMCCIGKLFGSKIIFIESFANIHTKTVTGRFVYKFADLFIVQWESMLELYPNAVYGGWIF